MTARDRMIVVVVLAAVALAGFWFVVLAPKRKEAADLQGKIALASQQLVDAQQLATQGRKAKARYNADYGAVATLGKAVPKSDALPSLLYQLQAAAHHASIDFTSLKVTGGGTQAGASSPPAAAASAAPSTGDSASKPPAKATDTATPAPATQAASAGLPPGAAVGSAGFPTMPFSFVFNGTFFDMERFLGEVERFVRVDGERVDVRGRLLSVDGFALSAGPGGFPNVKVNISATAYLLSPDDAGATAGTPSASGSTTASGGSTSAAPAATATAVAQ